MLATALLCFITLAGVNANFAEENGLRSNGLSFEVMTLECSETHCAKCYEQHYAGNAVVYLTTFEVTKDPFKYQLTVMEGPDEWKHSVVQGSKSEPFRACHETAGDYGYGYGWHWESCLEDHPSSALTIPEECATPVAVHTFTGHNYNNDPILGQQVLFCLPPT